MKTRQQLFDEAFKGLRSQGWARSHRAGACRYRGPDGLKCAIGHCILDADYRPYFEETSVANYEIRMCAGIEVADEGFSYGLQNAHDEAREPGDMENAMRLLAKRFNLTVPD